MLIFTLFQKDLATALGICNQISPKKADIELFTYCKIEIDPENKSLKLSALNSTVAYSTRVVANTDPSLTEKTAFLVNTDKFAGAVALLGGDQLELSININKKTMVVQGEKSKHTLRLNTEYTNDFLIPSEKPDNLEVVAKMPTNEFFNAIRSALVSVGDRNSYDPVFRNICISIFESQSKVQVVSTDRYRITKTVLAGQFSATSPAFLERSKETGRVNYLIDPKSLQLLVAATNANSSMIGADKSEDMSLKFESDFLWVQFGPESGTRNQLTLRYSDGSYPDYEKIIPQSFACNFELNTSETVSAIKQVYLSAKANTDNKSVMVTIKPAQSQLVMSAETTGGEASESILTIYNYAGQDEEWKQSFNADYLLGYLGGLDTEQVLWESNPGKPSVLSPFGQKERQLYLISGLK